MIPIGVHIKTESPLMLAANSSAHNLVETLEFIPGNSIRGALARRYLEKGGKAEDPVFRRLFLTGEVRFGFGRINGGQIIPLSARTCKYDGGFRVDGGHGVIDLLLPGEGVMTCPNAQCGRSIDYLKGYWNPISGKQETIHKRLITRTAIDPKRDQASQGRLYSQRVVEEDQVFHSVIEAPEKLMNELETLIAMPNVTALGTGRSKAGSGQGVGRQSEQMPNVMALGTGRSRGQGWVVLQKGPIDLPDWRTAEERFARYHDVDGKPVLAVTLLSDAILTDAYLRDRTVPDISHLTTMGIKKNEWESKPFRAFAATRKVSGFDGLPLQLPRLKRLAIEAGSTFLFRKADSARPTIPGGEGVGWIGEKNDEGFGEVILWHAFHIEQEKEMLS